MNTLDPIAARFHSSSLTLNQCYTTYPVEHYEPRVNLGLRDWILLGGAAATLQRGGVFHSHTKIMAETRVLRCRFTKTMEFGWKVYFC